MQLQVTHSYMGSHRPFFHILLLLCGNMLPDWEVSANNLLRNVRAFGEGPHNPLRPA